MLQELLVAFRTLVKQPGYAVSVILTLALGIGASASMFSLVDAALLRPLPFQQPDRLVMLTGVAGPQRSPRGASFPEIAAWRAMNTTLEDVALYDEMSLNLRIGSEAVRVEAELVSASYFPLLGVSAALGRTFLPDEDTTPDALLARAAWQEPVGAPAHAPAERSAVPDRRGDAGWLLWSLVRYGRLGAIDDGVSYERTLHRPESWLSLAARDWAAEGLARLSRSCPRARFRGTFNRSSMHGRWPSFWGCRWSLAGWWRCFRRIRRHVATSRTSSSRAAAPWTRASVRFTGRQSSSFW